MKKIALISAATAASLAFAPAAFATPPTQNLKVTLTSSKAGGKKKPTAIGITVSTGTVSAADDPSTKTITSARIFMPKGIKLNYNAFPACADPTTCADSAPESQVGSGTVKATVPQVPTLTGTLTPFIGTQGRLIIRTRITETADVDEPLIGKIQTAGGAYSFGFDVPLKLQTPLPDADQQLNEFTTKFDKKTVTKGTNKKGLVELVACPKSKKLVFRGEFTYKSGETVKSETTVKCSGKTK